MRGPGTEGEPAAAHRELVPVSPLQSKVDDTGVKGNEPCAITG